MGCRAILNLGTVRTCDDHQYPALVTCRPPSAISRSLTSCGSDDFGMSRRNSTAVASLSPLTPRGPIARTKRSPISPSSKATVSVM